MFIFFADRIFLLFVAVDSDEIGEKFFSAVIVTRYFGLLYYNRICTQLVYHIIKYRIKNNNWKWLYWLCYGTHCSRLKIEMRVRDRRNGQFL